MTGQQQAGDKDIFRYMKIQPDQFFLKFFLMWPILKIFIKFVTILLLFYVLSFFLAEGTLSSTTRGLTHIPYIGR